MDITRHPDSETYVGILVEWELSDEGTVDLVMVPQGTPLECWGDPMKQFIFHAPPEIVPQTLSQGALLNIHHKGTATFSIPPQGVALHVGTFLHLPA